CVMRSQTAPLESMWSKKKSLFMRFRWIVLLILKDTLKSHVLVCVCVCACVCVCCEGCVCVCVCVCVVIVCVCVICMWASVPYTAALMFVCTFSGIRSCHSNPSAAFLLKRQSLCQRERDRKIQRERERKREGEGGRERAISHTLTR